MRDNTKWIMLITAAAFVALMVFEWGMDASGQSSTQLTGGELGEVNGDPVTFEEYNVVYRDLYQQRQAEGDGAISSADNRRIEEEAWNQIVMDHLIQQELDRRGIEATPEEIRQAARFAPPPSLRQSEMFQTDGRFDLQKYQQFLAQSAGNSELMLQLERYYRDMIPRNKLYQQVLSGVHVTDAQLWQMWRDRNETVRIEYVALDPEQVVANDEVPELTDREIRAYYRTHREEFERPAKADVRLVALDKGATAADSAATLERVNELRQRILDGEIDFAEAARRESADPGSAEQGGDLGTVGPGEMVPAFDQAVWSLPVGQVGEPVLTQFGYHLILVESRSGDEEARVRHILIPVERGNESELELLERADSLEFLGETLSLDAAAEDLGLRVRTAELTEELPFVSGVGDVEEGVEWAFDLAEPGEISPVYEADGAFYMLEMVDFTPARIPALEDLESTIRSRLVRQKKMERARSVARNVVDAVRDGQSLEAAAADAGLGVQQAGPFTRMDFVPGIGRANAVIGTAFGLEQGATSGVVEANDRLYVLRSVERSPADREEWEQQRQVQRVRARQQIEQQYLQQFFAGLREHADIVDNRAAVLRPADEEQPASPFPPAF